MPPREGMLSTIYGLPRMGKTRLAWETAELCASKGIPSLVYDPYRQKWPGAVLVTDDIEELLAWALLKDTERRPINHSSLVVVDEGGWEEDSTALRRAMGLLAGQRGHHGHTVLFAMHAYSEAHTKARRTSDLLYLFRQGFSSAYEACREWGLPEPADVARKVAALPQLTAIRIVPGSHSWEEVKLW